MRLGVAQVLASTSAWGLRNVFGRPAAHFPGMLALRVDPDLFRHAAGRLKHGSICVVGTNGKTTVTNLLANVLEQCGQQVCCNKTGANLNTGVASALLSIRHADWGVFECDELWLASIAAGLQPRYIVLLNLFRDQLDRCGEIDHVQDRIVDALNSCPEAVLLYNADDPLCQAVADRVANQRFAFGIGQDLHLPQNSVTDGQMCQKCLSILEYDYRQYGQLGAYRCTGCGFERAPLDACISDVQLAHDSVSFTLDVLRKQVHLQLSAPLSGHYSVYNVAAAALAALMLGAEQDQLVRTVAAFDPHNGRQQQLVVGQHKVLLNLAKNPTGFNQSINLVAQCQQPCAVAFFVNDKEADGHDVSWLWDVDFERLKDVSDLRVFAGGLRKGDVQVRLKYAGISACLVQDAQELVACCADIPDASIFAISNYTALPSVKTGLERMEKQGIDALAACQGNFPIMPEYLYQPDMPPVVIAHMLPDLLNLYGDGGNVRILAQRLRWRGIPVEVRLVSHGYDVDFSHVDLVVMGGSPDKEQRLASADLFAMRDALAGYVEDDGPLLAICGSYQILGNTWLADGQEVPGLGIIDMVTTRRGDSTDRLVDNVVIESPSAGQPVVGYENHAGRTFLASGLKPFGRVISATGCGNNEEDHADGVRYNNVIGTYLHGPLLSKNPDVADWLLRRALEHHAKRTGCPHHILRPLPDEEEHGAHKAMIARLLKDRD